MSCNLVSSKHIDALLNFANQQPLSPRVALTDGRVIDFKNSDDLNWCAVLLTMQNFCSYNTRYEKYEEPTMPVKYHMDWKVYKPVEIVKACDGYDYQACEVPDYDHSDARKVVAAIRRSAISAMPEYRAAQTWSID